MLVILFIPPAIFFSFSSFFLWKGVEDIALPGPYKACYLLTQKIMVLLCFFITCSFFMYSLRFFPLLSFFDLFFFFRALTFSSVSVLFLILAYRFSSCRIKLNVLWFIFVDLLHNFADFISIIKYNSLFCIIHGGKKCY